MFVLGLPDGHRCAFVFFLVWIIVQVDADVEELSRRKKELARLTEANTRSFNVVVP